MSRDIHLVGSINLSSAEDVLRTVGRGLGDKALRLTDGETGVARSVWIQCQYPFFLGHPQLQMLEEDGDGSMRPPRVPAGGMYTKTRAGLYKGRARLRPGVRAQDVRFDDLGYADWALESYAEFEQLQAEGAIAAHTRFQVDLPSPSSCTRFLFPDLPEISAAYELGLFNEAAKIAAAIPPDRLAIQWDSTDPVTYVQASSAQKEALVADLARLAGGVPEPVQLGFHLCYGDFEGRHTVEPTDLGATVEMANRISEQVDRRVDWVHMPVPRDRSDPEYFAPLTELRLRPGTRLILGLVHDTDGLAGTRKRIEAAAAVYAEFGIATECGMGRRAPESIPDLLRLHVEAAEI